MLLCKGHCLGVWKVCRGHSFGSLLPSVSGWQLSNGVILLLPPRDNAVMPGVITLLWVVSMRERSATGIWRERPGRLPNKVQAPSQQAFWGPHSRSAMPGKASVRPPLPMRSFSSSLSSAQRLTNPEVLSFPDHHKNQGQHKERLPASPHPEATQPDGRGVSSNQTSNDV